MDRSKLTAEQNALLDSAIAARQSDKGYMFGTKKDFQPLIDAGAIEVNEGIREGKGANVKYAMRATDAAVAQDTRITTGNQPPAQGATTSADAAKPASAFKIRKDVPLPKIERPQLSGPREPRDSKYPFDDLELPEGAEYGDSFHVPVTEDMPDPAKTMASSLSAAKRRHSVELEGTHLNRKGTRVPNFRMERNFVMREVKGVTADNPNGDPDGDGVRIFRYKLPENPVFDKDMFKGKGRAEPTPGAPAT